jgi:cobalt/nickel transport protein
MRTIVFPFALSVAVALASASVAPSSAHFQMLYGGNSALVQRGVDQMLLVFTHPFSGGPTMAMGQPEAFYVRYGKGDDTEPLQTDLLPFLTEITFDGGGEKAAAFRADLPTRLVRSMGDYVFALAPSPFFEETEDKYIQQFTKTVFNVGGVPGNWAEPSGLPVEILPLDKPYANWVGGVFRGIVVADGEPVPFAEIEVEYVTHVPDFAAAAWEGGPSVTAPHPSLEAQSIRADANGTFTIGLPRAGWWGIGALDVGTDKEHDGKPLSQDAVLWVQATDMN